MRGIPCPECDGLGNEEWDDVRGEDQPYSPHYLRPRRRICLRCLGSGTVDEMSGKPALDPYLPMQGPLRPIADAYRSLARFRAWVAPRIRRRERIYSLSLRHRDEPSIALDRPRATFIAYAIRDKRLRPLRLR